MPDLMAAGGVSSGAFAAVAVAVYADLAYNVMSATNSSPQTTELFAADRADTLWKYVKLGELQIALFGAFGSILYRSLWPAVGAGAGLVAMHLMYRHALAAGGGTSGG